jgi:hypothetical protein
MWSRLAGGILCGFAMAAAAQSPSPAPDEDFHVYSDSPRLLLTKDRLRRLQRERDRHSPRWMQFDALISGGAPLPEPGFAAALYSQVAKDPASARLAIEWAVSDRAEASRDLRQLALVFDWCGAAMTKSQADKLFDKIQRGLAAPVDPANDIHQQSARAMAAIAIADRLPDHGEAILKSMVTQWWRTDVMRRITSGHPAAPREQTYAMFELLHAIRDNLKIDLRESSLTYFRQLPIDQLAGHYPAALQTPENEFRVPVYVRDGDPDVNDCTMARAAELAMVGYDDNAVETQFVQGWLMQDRFVMQGGLGAVYEFMWANPYQPGLSYFHVPLVFHDVETGHLFARTSWDEDALWMGFFEGHLQLFRDGRIQSLRVGADIKPVRIGDALLVSSPSAEAWRFQVSAEAVFVLNLTPRAKYDVEVDDEELWEVDTDAGGTMVLSFPEGMNSGVRIKRR